MHRNFKKCLITGITGSGGSFLAEYILRQNKKIHLHGTFRSDGYKKILKKNKRIKLHKLDLQNYVKVQHLIKKIKPDLIYHLASNADVRASFNEPLNFIKNNNLITANLLEAIRISKSDPLVIICSTSEVYGIVNAKSMPITEKQMISPINPYAVTKAFQDLLSQVYCKAFNLKIIITRMFSYTNSRRSNLFQTSFAEQIARIENKKQKILFHGNLKSIRTFIDIDDAMRAYWLVAKKGKIGKIYNIGGSTVISVEEYLRKLISLSKEKIITKLDRRLMRPKDIPLQLVDSSEFKKDTGWKPRVSFNESINKLLNDCRNKN